MALVPKQQTNALDIDFLELVGLKKLLKSDRKDVVKRFLELVASKDEKIALQAVIAYLKLDVEVAKEVASDQLTRAIASYKLGLNKPTMLEEEGRPKIDFSNIQDLDAE